MVTFQVGQVSLKLSPGTDVVAVIQIAHYHYQTSVVASYLIFLVDATNHVYRLVALNVAYDNKGRFYIQILIQPLEDDIDAVFHLF